MLVLGGSGTPETYTFSCPLEPASTLTSSLTAWTAGLAASEVHVWEGKVIQIHTVLD